MVFNSYTFIAFFIVMLILHNLPLSWKAKKVNLLNASYIFKAAWNPPFILLLWLSTVVDFFVGRALYNQENKYRRKLLLVVSLVGNLGMLCFFKYGGFLLDPSRKCNGCKLSSGKTEYYFTCGYFFLYIHNTLLYDRYV